MGRHKILFITLQTFSSTGGIEKVCKIIGKALYELEVGRIRIFSIYDKQNEIDTKYFSAEIFKGFAAQKLKSFYNSIKEGVKCKVVILSHINLLPIGYFIKKFSPKTKLVLFAHGIEVWEPLSKFKKKMLTEVDLIIAVSNFTIQKMYSLHNLHKVKYKVINNCLDPFLQGVINESEQLILREKYKLTHNNFTLITVTRISGEEQYKGHDRVIESMSKVIDEFPYLRYLIVGKYDLSEKNRLDSLIKNYQLTDKVIFTGFVQDEALAPHYKLADVFVMPSKGEGFGIVFIEAMFYGLPVIAGNKDGSVEPLCNGKLGLLVNPDDAEEIASAIKKIIFNKNAFVPNQNILMENFSYDTYKQNVKAALENLN